MYLHMICVFEVYRYLRPPSSLKSGFRVPQEMVSGSFCSYFQHSLAAKRVWMPYTMGCVMKLKYSLYHCSLDIQYISGGCKQSCEHHDDWLHTLKKTYAVLEERSRRLHFAVPKQTQRDKISYSATTILTMTQNHPCCSQTMDLQRDCRFSDKVAAEARSACRQVGRRNWVLLVVFVCFILIW